MNEDFKESTILLMQHPIMSKPISELSSTQCIDAFDLIENLVISSINEKYTQIDYIQMARLEFQLGELEYALNDDKTKGAEYFRSALQLLQKGGFDLSLNKWTELVSLRIND